MYDRGGDDQGENLVFARTKVVYRDIFRVFRLTGCTGLFPNRFPALRISSEMGFGMKGMALVFRARFTEYVHFR